MWLSANTIATPMPATRWRMAPRSPGFTRTPKTQSEGAIMLFIVSGRDKVGGIAARLQFRTQHRAYYAALGEDLILAGPYLDGAGEPIGSMIVMRAPDQEAAERFARADP